MREDARKQVEKALASLHKGLGVRRKDLQEKLGQGLREVWKINAKDMEGVRAQTILRLEEIIAGIPDPALAQLARVFYNIPLDPETMDRKYLQRLDVLHRRLGSGHAARTSMRDLQKVVFHHLKASLDKTWPEISDTEKRSVIERERHHLKLRNGHAGNTSALTQPLNDDESLLTEVRDLQNPDASADRTIRRFRATRLQVPRCAAESLAVVRTAMWGDWVCAFTSAARFLKYKQEVAPSWADRPFELLGAELLQEIHRRELQVGVLINPKPNRNDGDVSEMLSLPPRLVHELATESL